MNKDIALYVIIAYIKAHGREPRADQVVYRHRENKFVLVEWTYQGLKTFLTQ